MQITPIGLVISVIQKNSLNFMVVIPAIKHKMSSGKSGSKNAIIKKNFPLLLIMSAYFTAFSFPAIQITKLKPKTFPTNNEQYEPSKTPVVQSYEPTSGPYIATPVKVIIIDGIGTDNTCMN